MDPVEELQEPDEARPAKRVRLEAPLAITEEIQEEILDDDDWDDIYGSTETPKKAFTPDGGNSPKGGVRLPLEPVEDEPVDTAELDKSEVEDGILDESTNVDEALVAPQQTAIGTDEPSNRILEETSQVETGRPRKDDTSQPEVDGIPEEHFYDDASTDPRAEESMVNGPSRPTENNSTQDKPEDDILTSQQPKAEQDPDFIAAAAAQKENEKAEWQFDSSDAEPSSDSESDSSSHSSDDSDSGSDGGYELLDPATAAKILMAGDGDDEGGDKSKNKTGDHQPRTANEVKEDVVPKPDVVVTEDMKITHLGNVDRIVESMVLIKAVTPGEFQVLESGSVLCNEKREVIGAVAETLGRVQEPMYSVAFTNAKEIEDMGLEFGAKVFYVDSHSTFVFTQPLKNLKGTDASNIHDEEVGEDELEFSDDEKEAEYKRLKKLAKRGGRGGLSRSAFNEDRAMRDFDAPGSSNGNTFANGSDVPQQQYGGGMNYDDGDVEDEFYNPLKRPDNLSQLMAGGPPPMPERGGFRGRGRGYDRGRGDRGRGRGDRGRGRGGFDHRNQRGGRGGQGQDDRGRGDFGQQNGHRGPAHSFPDRHNHSNNRRRNAGKHQFNRGGSNASHSTSPPPQQQYPPYQPQYQQQPPTPQNYQFNGYTFQYSNSPPPPPAPQTGYYNQQQMAAQTAAPSIPAGAFVNPAFFQNQQAQAQWPQPQAQQQPSHPAWPAQQYQQYAQAGAAQPPQQAPTNLADILRQLGGYQQQQR